MELDLFGFKLGRKKTEPLIKEPITPDSYDGSYVLETGGVFGTFVFGVGASLIQSGVVPAAPVTLSWSSWDEMAESAGISRKYGGIHATSAHTGSVAAANVLHTVLGERFRIDL